MSKKALGKGLEALFQTTQGANYSEPGGAEEKAVDASGGIGHFVDIEKIVPNPDQPRKEFDKEHLEELAASISEKGVLQPLLVEKRNDRFVIIAGERRFRAARIAGLKEIPVIEKNLSEEEKYEIALIENIQREDLSPIEEAKAYLTLINNYSLGQEELSKKIGRNRSTIANSLRLLKMPQDMQDALSSGEITSGHARAILSVVNPADQRILFSRILTSSLSVREAEKQASELNRGMRRQQGKSDGNDMLQKKKSPDIMHVEQKFIDRLGTKVSLKGSITRGKIEISYFSKDDLERIFEIITG